MLALMEKKLMNQLQGQNKGKMALPRLLSGGVDMEVMPLSHLITHSNQ